MVILVFSDMGESAESDKELVSSPVEIRFAGFLGDSVTAYSENTVEGARKWKRDRVVHREPVPPAPQGESSRNMVHTLVNENRNPHGKRGQILIPRDALGRLMGNGDSLRMPISGPNPCESYFPSPR